MNLTRLFRRRISTHEAASSLGRLGGHARAEQQAAMIRATTRRIREELGLGPDRRLG